MWDCREVQRFQFTTSNAVEVWIVNYSSSLECLSGAPLLADHRSEILFKWHFPSEEIVLFSLKEQEQTMQITRHWLILPFCTMVACLNVIWDCYDCSITVWLIDWSGPLSITLCTMGSTVVHKKGVLNVLICFYFVVSIVWWQLVDISFVGGWVLFLIKIVVCSTWVLCLIVTDRTFDKRYLYTRICKRLISTLKNASFEHARICIVYCFCIEKVALPNCVDNSWEKQKLEMYSLSIITLANISLHFEKFFRFQMFS